MSRPKVLPLSAFPALSFYPSAEGWHCYVSGRYVTAREHVLLDDLTVVKACDLIELFARHPNVPELARSRARAWLESNVPAAERRPCP